MPYVKPVILPSQKLVYVKPRIMSLPSEAILDVTFAKGVVGGKWVRP